jgi:hypothetical protein
VQRGRWRRSLIGWRTRSRRALPAGARGGRPGSRRTPTRLAAWAPSSTCSRTRNYLDLDPSTRDNLGRPVVRITFDFHEQEYRMSNYIATSWSRCWNRRSDRGVEGRRGREPEHARLRRNADGDNPDLNVVDRWGCPTRSRTSPSSEARRSAARVGGTRRRRSTRSPGETADHIVKLRLHHRLRTAGWADARRRPPSVGWIG